MKTRCLRPQQQQQQMHLAAGVAVLLRAPPVTACELSLDGGRCSRAVLLHARVAVQQLSRWMLRLTAGVPVDLSSCLQVR